MRAALLKDDLIAFLQDVAEVPVKFGDGDTVPETIKDVPLPPDLEQRRAEPGRRARDLTGAAIGQEKTAAAP